LGSKLGLDLHGALHVALEGGPAVVDGSASAGSGQLDEVLVEALHLGLVELFLALHGARARLEALATDGCLVQLDSVSGGQGVGERLEVGDELLVGAAAFGSRGRRLFNLADKRGMLALEAVALGRGRSRCRAVGGRGEGGRHRACSAGGLCAGCGALLDGSLVAVVKC
jgi:hypothetical protein